MNETVRKCFLTFTSSLGMVIPITVCTGMFDVNLDLAFAVFFAGVLMSVTSIFIGLPVLKKEDRNVSETHYALFGVLLAGASFGGHIVALMILLISVQISAVPF